MSSYTLTEEILQKLISFPTVSRDSNLDLIAYIQHYLSSFGISSTLTHNDEKTKANLHATIGPNDKAGIMLSGHTDVVPVDGQNWTVAPFEMSFQDGRLYGRGSCDMKGYIASVLAAVPDMVEADLIKPIHLAFSYDEEIGCVGVQRMVDMLESAPIQPAFCLIGEPTEMQVAVAHKGKTGAICRCTGVEAHSALATSGLNAIYLATKMIGGIQDIQESIIQHSPHDHGYTVPYSTLHVGTIKGGTALNIIPKHCEFKFEIRNTSNDDPAEIMDQIRHKAQDIASSYHAQFPEADIAIEIFNEYPGLDVSPEHEVVAFMKRLMETDDHIKLSFGTEGGVFQKRLGIPSIVCGPGSMKQGHKPDEYVAQTELARCDVLMKKIIHSVSN